MAGAANDKQMVVSTHPDVTWVAVKTAGLSVWARSMNLFISAIIMSTSFPSCKGTAATT